MTANPTGIRMKIISLKTLPDFTHTAPLAVMIETLAILWAKGRGEDVLYWCEPAKQWIVKVNDEKVEDEKATE